MSGNLINGVMFLRDLVPELYRPYMTIGAAHLGMPWISAMSDQRGFGAGLGSHSSLPFGSEALIHAASLVGRKFAAARLATQQEA